MADGTAARGLLGRASWNLVDQVLSSTTNAVLSFLVARTVSDTAFGGFAVAFTVFALVVGLTRALATSPLGIRFADEEPAAFADAVRRAVGASFGVGVLGGAGALLAAALVATTAGGGPAATCLAALGVVLPGLLVQDAWRYAFFAAGRPAAAAANDAVWAVVQLAAVGALLVGGVRDAWPLVGVWGFSALAAAVLGSRQARLRPQLARARRWVREHVDLTRYLVAEFATLQGGQQGALLLIAVVGSLEAIGALRGVQVLLGPTTILATAALTFAVPEFARRRADLTARQWKVGALALGNVVASLGVAWGVLFLLLPDVVGRTLLGDTWPGVQAVLVPTVVAQAAATLGVGPTAALLARGRARLTFGVHVVEAALILVGGVGGVLVGGAYGAAWGLAVAPVIAAPLLWWRLVGDLSAASSG